MQTGEKKYFKFSPKFFLLLLACLLVRLIPLRAPNIEPILAAAMPMGRAYGAFTGFSFGVLSIILYDIATSTLGVRTVFTALAYGLLGLGAAIYLKDKKADKWSYVKVAVAGTLFFDALTGLTVGPIFFGQSFMGALAGQIPFTALHLLGNTVFAYVLSPGLYNFLVKKKAKAPSTEIISNFNPKII
jgi:hypothetical protein